MKHPYLLIARWRQLTNTIERSAVTGI